MQLELAHMRNLVCLEKGKKNSKGQTIKKISFDLRHKRRKKAPNQCNSRLKTPVVVQQIVIKIFNY